MDQFIATVSAEPEVPTSGADHSLPTAKQPHPIVLLSESTDEATGRTERVSALTVNNVGSMVMTEIILRRKDATKTIYQHSVTSVYMPNVKVGDSKDAQGNVLGKELLPIR